MKLMGVAAMERSKKPSVTPAAHHDGMRLLREKRERWVVYSRFWFSGGGFGQTNVRKRTTPATMQM